jgi:hypothetical protein
MRLFQTSNTRACEALERIAFALETLAGISERNIAPGDTSAVLYTDDIADLKREIRRDLYAERTGITLPWDEDPPDVPAAEEEKEDA